MRAWMIVAALTLVAGAASAQSTRQPDPMFPRPESAAPVNAKAKPAYYLPEPDPVASVTKPAAITPFDSPSMGSMWTSFSGTSAPPTTTATTDATSDLTVLAPLPDLGAAPRFENGSTKVCTGEGETKVCK